MAKGITLDLLADIEAAKKEAIRKAEEKAKNDLEAKLKDTDLEALESEAISAYKSFIALTQNMASLGLTPYKPGYVLVEAEHYEALVATGRPKREAKEGGSSRQRIAPQKASAIAPEAQEILETLGERFDVAQVRAKAGASRFAKLFAKPPGRLADLEAGGFLEVVEVVKRKQGLPQVFYALKGKPSKGKKK